MLSEVLSSSKQLFRIEAEYFQRKYLEIEKRFSISPSINSVNSKITCGPFGSNLLDTLYENDGVLVVRPFNLKKCKVEDENLVYITEEGLKANNLKTFKEGTLLFSRVGDIKIGVLNKKKKTTISPNIIAVEFDNDVVAKFLCVFYQTKFGYGQIERQLKISAQPTISTEIIGELKFPLLSSQFQNKISFALEKSFELDNLSNNIYIQAENLLLESLCLENFFPSDKNINIKSFKKSFLLNSRLDAEYYQPKYEDYERLIKQNSKGFTRIVDEYDLVKETSRKNKEAYNYIEISDINVGDGSASFNRIEISDLPDNAKNEVKFGDLLISKVRPNRGAVSIIDFDDTNLIVSGAFAVLRKKPKSVFSNEMLKVLLRTNIYRDWLLQFNIGTQYPVIRDEDILNLPIPKIDHKTQSQISLLIKESFTLRSQSEKLLEVSKKGVEMAIEESEEKAIKFIGKSQ